ncbi:hypothetical protein MPTK1_4g00600 [Marchantia polymorpha subsp. ruderalis]|uniref:Uncharacterized protein n=2 Tax=Marchantia polymorpha TaxID=3197 RepID=A0AAF6B4X2_MARPO|nr:hypothetical protein MARPO_0066s0081 [Marchantia polymorpha]BBN07056.1 hypothetical protein Mp_4g00600 [Marchantia polymorpha subsp. ruderalis]|eukprot:PTQ36128.1 hypothetical protein MARPO_0066s0081 [Marchantia polymorpha]
MESESSIEARSDYIRGPRRRMGPGQFCFRDRGRDVIDIWPEVSKHNEFGFLQEFDSCPHTS